MSFSFDLKFDESLEILLDSMNGIGSTKTLILNLATSGRLAPQLADEVHPRDFLDSINEVEVVHQSVSGWLSLNLGDCAEIYNGNSTSASEKAVMERNQFGLNYIATKDVGYGFQPIEYNTGLRIGNKSDDFKIAPVNSILICLEGGSAGKKMGLVKQEIAFGNKLFAVVPRNWIEPKYLLMYFLSSKFQSDFRNQMSGIIGGISKAKFSNLKIPLPPINEQKRIVSIAEKLISICDELEEKVKKQSVLGELSRKSTLDAVATAQSPEDMLSAWRRVHMSWDVTVHTPESVEEIRKLILDLAVRGDLVRIQRPETFQIINWTNSELNLDDSKLWLLPTLHKELKEGWNRIPLAKIGSWGSGGTPTASRKDYYEHGTIPWAVIGDLNNGIMTTTEAKITEKALRESSSKLVPKGSILIAMYGASIGKTAISGIDCCTNQAIAHCDVDTSIVSRDYFFIVAKSLKRHLIREGKGAAQPNISQSVLKHLIIDLPPLSEQELIVERVTHLMGLCDELEIALRQSELLAENFTRSVVSMSA